MRTIPLPLLAAFLLATLISAVNVAAYKQASPVNGLSLTVDSTGSAGLALAGGTGNPAYQVSTYNGMLQIDFRKGFGGSPFTFQPTGTGANGVSLSGDIFQMRQVMTVTNNGGHCQDVAVYVAGSAPTNLAAIYGRLTGGAIPGTQLATTNGAATGGTVKLGVGSNNQMQVDFWWDATSTVASAGTFTVRVSGSKSATCP